MKTTRVVSWFSWLLILLVVTSCSAQPAADDVRQPAVAGQFYPASPEQLGKMIDGFLAAGHVCSVMGFREYPTLAEKFKVPIVITGFEPLDLLDGIRRTVVQLEQGEHSVENAYPRMVSLEGNRPAQKLMSEVFEVTDRAWRGIGVIPQSGWRLNADYRDFDAEHRFQITGLHTEESPLCHAGEVLRGALKPAQCPAFGKQCTPRHPLGATMVSSEGACAAYFNYGRFISAEELAQAGR